MGVGRANNIDDVLLVQYLLNLWLQHPSSGSYRSMARPGGAAALKQDGLFGPRTAAQIILFQAAMAVDRNAPILADGCIDRIPGGDNFFIPGGKGMIYTILGLNAEVSKLYVRENGSMLDLAGLQGFPSKLIPMIARYAIAQNFR